MSVIGSVAEADGNRTHQARFGTSTVLKTAAATRSAFASREAGGYPSGTPRPDGHDVAAGIVAAMDTGIQLVVDGSSQALDTDSLPVAAKDGILHLGAALAVPNGRWVTVRAGGDDYVASIPAAEFTAGAELTVESRRLIVREGSTLCWNVKDVRRIEVGDERQPDSVPENPTH